MNITKRITKFLLIAALAFPAWTSTAAQDAEKQAEFEKARIAAETGQALDISVPRAPKPSGQTTRLNAPKNVNRTTLTTTVCNGTQTSGYAPVYGYWFDYGTTTQMIYPKSALGDLQAGDVITSLKFYANSTISSSIGSPTVTVYVGNTDDSEVGQTLTAINENREDETQVFQGRLSISGSEMTVTFSQGYEYTGSNLIVDFQTPSGGSAARTNWYGATASANSFVCVYGSSSSVVGSSNTSFLPKMTITYNRIDVPYLAELTGNGAFGVIQKGTSATSTFTVTNQGANAFTPVLTSSNAAFTVAGDMTTQLAPGDSRNFTVTFTATTATQYDGTLTLSAPESNDITGSAVLSGEGSIAVTVADGTATDGHIPVWGYNYDIADTHHQMIYPASMLGDVAGKKIKSITFYPSTSGGIQFGGGTLTVTMGTTTVSAYASAGFQDLTGTTVSKDIVPTKGDQIMHIEFDTPFEFNSGNLIIDTQVTTKGSYGSTSWYGVNPGSYQSYYYCASSSYGGSNRLQFLPKITFELEEAVSVDKTELDFGTVAVGTASAAQTVTVGNSTGSNVAVSWTFSNNMFSTTATAGTVQAGSVMEIPVIFTPSATGAQTGTLTINAGGQTFIVALSGNGLEAYAATIDQQTINFGNIAVGGHGTASVTITNTGMNDITPTLTQPAAPFSVTGGAGALVSGETRTYTITFTPEAVGDYSGTFTIADADHNISYTVTLSGKGVELDPITVDPASLDFGTVNKGSTKDLTVTYTNPNNEAVAVTLSVPAPYSAAPSSFSLAANGTQTVTVTFAPSAAISYHRTLTASAAGLNTDVALNGYGRVEGSPEAIRDEAFFEGIPYTWTDSVGTTHTNTLNEIATDPDQIIAMLKEVYVNRNIPGNYKRGYTSTGAGDHDDDVLYTGVGTINSSGQFVDTYGWDIPGNVLNSTGSTSYMYLQEDQYRPYDEGVTLLLLEIVDDFDVTKIATNGDPTHDYPLLRTYFKKAIKSARVITEAKRTGEKSDFSSGTLFKIDCNKMNKFYLIAKGQLGWLKQRANNSNSSSATTYSFYGYPMYYDGTYLDYGLNGNYLDKEPAFLCHMFEQLSPAEGNSENALSDGYQMFVTEMKSFGIIHDCPNVPFVLGKGHHFMMYGADSSSDDCQDIRDMMLFVPDYRMMDWDYRGSKETATASSNRKQDYFYYNENHQPSIGVFVIHQNPITGEQITGQETYRLHLTWTSNLLKYLPNEDGQYDLYRVITNADGTKTYQKVGEFDPNTFEYYDNVPMQKTGQQVTYVVQGRDVGKFLSLQMSNEESFIIPGLDREEQLRIDLNSDYYFSRYDAGEQRNYYSNSLIANNTVGTNVKPSYIQNGSVFKFWRATLKTVEGQTVVDTDNAVNFVQAVVSNYTQTGGGTLNYGTWVDQSDFSGKPYGHGYHTNPTTSRIRIVSGEVVFDGLKLYDNFCVDVSANEHPAQYIYYVTLQTAESFIVYSSLPDFVTWQTGKTFAYFERPSDWYNYYTVRAWAWKDNGNGTQTNLTGDGWPGNGVMTWVGKNNGNDVYLWAVDETSLSVQPTHILFNCGYDTSSEAQTANYEFINGGYYTRNNEGGIINTSNAARSNTVAVPVYKTEMEMKPITAAQVDADLDRSVPAGTKFEVDARYSSKTEILGYYIYRWADKAGASARTIYDSEGEDASPQGQAGNQGEYYTVAMNTDYTAETEHFASDYADVTATFLDNFMNNDATEADTYTYAPVVELFAPAQAVVLPSGEDRDDYNTYGGPQQMTAGGLITINLGTIFANEDEFTPTTTTGTTEKCKYYYIPVTINVDLPSSYEIYKVRAWRLIDKQWLGEEESQYSDRVSDDYLFETLGTEANNVNDVQIGEGSVDGNAHHHKGLFGAKSLSNTESFDATFIVRVYFTKPSKDGEVKYYIAEKQETVNVNNQNIITGVVNVKSNKQVAGVKYYNMAGIESDQPFDGVNIVVTRYTDGSTSTSKVIK